MKIIYSCYGGAHTSIVSAAIHVGYLPSDTIPSYKAIESVPYYDKSNWEDIGKPIFMGLDEFNNEVYVVGMGPHRKECSQLIYGFTNEIFGHCKGKIIVVNSIALINLPIRVGGFLSRRIKLVTLGKAMTIYGIILKYRYFSDLVQQVKEVVKNQP